MNENQIKFICDNINKFYEKKLKFPIIIYRMSLIKIILKKFLRDGML